MNSQVLKVRGEKISACMTCSLCNELLVEATTICECLHTFCKKCITDKITEEDVHCCPKCNTDLGTHPLNKLRSGIAPLPQIPSRYLRIKDGNVPVSYIKKYLGKKLNLVNEFEVDSTLRGQSLLDTWQLQELIDLWLQIAPVAQVIQTTVGSSAKDTVMVLLYGRKIYGV